ncbi:MAG: ChaN family lipoprotein [Hasllibacter sp.]
MRHLIRAAALAAAPAFAQTADTALVPPRGLDVLIVGEAHDNPEHHLNQAAAAKRATAVVWEMLTPAMATQYDPALLDDPAALDAAIGWSAEGWPDIAIYLPIFEALPDGPHWPGGAGSVAPRLAMAEGAAAAFGEGAARYGLADPLPAGAQAAREVRMAEVHCGMLPEDLLPGMVEAQRLRDAVLARAAIQALDRFGPPVLVVTGNGHAALDGVPAALMRADPEIAVRTVGQLEAPPEGAPPFDRWLVTGAPERGDPCGAFR